MTPPMNHVKLAIGLFKELRVQGQEGFSHTQNANFNNEPCEVGHKFVQRVGSSRTRRLLLHIECKFQQ